jgi:GNAT superfamily N-acetyltransferase
VSRDDVWLGAQNLADWHDAALRAAGYQSVRTPTLWSAPAGRPMIYLAAVTLAPGIAARDVDAALAGAEHDPRVCDSYSDVDLGPLGWRQHHDEPWFVRPAGELAVPDAPGLDVAVVTGAADLREVERVDVLAFSDGESAAPAEPFYATPLLTDPRVRIWLGRVDGEPAAIAVSYATDDSVGVYGVATVPRFRRRGYGAHLTALATRAELGRPACLQPSAAGLSTYTRLGFRPVGRLRQWVRGSAG